MISFAFIIAFAALWILVGFLAFAVIGHLRRIEPVLRQAERHLAAEFQEGLRPGSPLPDFHAMDDSGRPFGRVDLERPALLLFLEPDCGPCEAIAIEIKDSPWRSQIPVYLVTDSSADARSFASSLGLPTLYQTDEWVSHAFRTFYYPKAFVIGEDDRIAMRITPNRLSDLQSAADSVGRGVKDHRMLPLLPAKD